MPLRIWVIGSRTSSAPSGKAIVRAPGGALACGLTGAAVRADGRPRAAGGGPGPDRLDHGEHVVAGDAAAAAGPDDLLGAQAVLAQEPADGRGHAGVGVTGRRECRRGREWRGCRRGDRNAGRSRSRSRGGGRRDRSLVGVGRAIRRRRGTGRCGRLHGAGRRGGFSFVTRVDDRDLGVVRHRGAFLGQDLGEDALERRRDLGVDLVGDDLEERLVLVDVVAGLLEPFPDRALGDALTELGHRHLRHVRSSSKSAGRRT